MAPCAVSLSPSSDGPVCGVFWSPVSYSGSSTHDSRLNRANLQTHTLALLEGSQARESLSEPTQEKRWELPYRHRTRPCMLSVRIAFEFRIHGCVSCGERRAATAAQIRQLFPCVETKCRVTVEAVVTLWLVPYQPNPIIRTCLLQAVNTPPKRTHAQRGQVSRRLPEKQIMMPHRLK